MNQQTCNSAWLDAFLKNDLNESQEQILTLHLDECSDCREELESRAAEQSAWREASNLLGGAKVPDLSAINALNCGEVHENHLNARSPQIELVLQQLAPTDDPESLGRIGGYEVTGVVGAGGMGVVLKAHDRSLDRVVAIKVMSPHLASSGSARKRFAREAKAAAAVLHPNVIAIHSVASEEASPYLVMPYVRGASLQKRIDSQGPLPLKDTLRIGAQIAAGLAAAHEQGLVHRDIKPANILLEEGVERVTITDFGLARAVDDASMTCSGVIAGTPQYMSPEQTRGEPIDARSDLFSLGSVLYAMCAGRSPFRAETTYGVLHRIANDNPTAVCEVNSDVPVWLGNIIERLMSKRPDDRFESAVQVAELLEGCLAHVQQPAAVPLPEAVASLALKKTCRPPIGKYIAAAAGAIALFFAGVLIVLELDKGTLTIESEIDDVPIRIMQGDEVVKSLTVSKEGATTRISAGKYIVEIGQEFDKAVVKDGGVELSRGATAIIRVTRINVDTAESEKAKDEAAQAWLRRPVVGSTHDGKSFQLAGHDALMHCVMTNNSESLNRLLAMDKYDLDRSPGNGQWTLLQTALQHSCLETTSLLLRYGANPNFASTGTPLPLELAQRSGQPKLVALVQEYLELADTHPHTKENEAKKQSQSLSAGTMESKNSVDAERASNSVKRVIQYMSAVQQNDTETIKSIAKGILNSDECTRVISLVLDKRGIPKLYKTWFENHSAVVALGPISSSDVNFSGRFLLFTLSLADERWSIVDIDLEESLLERFKTLSPKGTVSDATIKSLQGVWEFISVESDGVVREHKTLKTQPAMARLTITGDMWIVKAGDGSDGSDLGSGGHRVKIDGNKLTFYGTTTSMPGLGSSKEISTIGYGLFRIDGDSLVYIVTPAVAGGDFTGQSELPIKFPETFATKGTRNNVFRLRKVGAGESAAHDPNSSKVPTSKSSHEFPPVKILVQDEEGKPLKGVQVSLFQSPTKEGGQILEISETSDEKGMAVSRNLPFGHYELSAKTAEGWYLPGNGSKINVEFEKGIDFTLVAPSPVPFVKLTIRDDVKTHSASVSELRFGILEEVNGPGFWVSGAPEPEADLGDFETFPTLTNGIEHVGVEIRFEVAKNISQPSLSASHLKTKWEWAPLDKANSSRRYLIANGQARGFVNGTVYEYKALHAQPREDSKLFHLPSSKHRVGASLITLREPTALPLELAIPAGEISIYVERFLGKPNAATLEALNRQMTGDQEELWLEANVQRNSAWIERLVDITGWIPTILKPGYNEISGHLQMRKLMKSGENLEISLGRQKLNTKESNPLEARTIDDVTSVYNEQTRQLRTELFNPPIPNLTTDQMRVAMLDAAEQYRKQSKVEIASALNTSVESSRLVDRLTFIGSMGTAPTSFRQITPVFHYEIAGNALESIVLPKAELRYSRYGWTSKSWGDIHPPITGKWDLVSVEERGETLTQDSYDEWRQKHTSWTELTIDARSLTMADENATKFDFSVDYDAGVLPQYTISQDGNTKYSGVLMGNGFVDDTTLVLAVDIKGSSKPKTFHTKDGKTTNLTFRRNGVAGIAATADEAN